jgi:hypothetical protein
MGGKIVLGPFLVLLEGIIKDDLKASRRGSRNILGHRSGNKGVICVEGKIVGVWEVRSIRT